MKMFSNEGPLIALSSLVLGQTALIVAFSFDTEQGEQIHKMGLVPGEKLEIVRLPPLGDPIEIKIRGYFISLSRKEADRIKVKILS